jgi:glutathione peroxidase
MPGLHDITVKDASKKDFPLSQLAGKMTLIVNVASRCGYTNQYKGLQSMYEKLQGKGVEILGFPWVAKNLRRCSPEARKIDIACLIFSCNQFGGQEPGTEEEIVTFW